MERKRWAELMRDDDKELTQSEIDQGWHFCHDWDGLLVGPGMGEQKNCCCFKKEEKW